MRLLLLRPVFGVIVFLVIAAMPSAPAQEQAPAADRKTAAPLLEGTVSSPPPSTLTGKERLGEKWKDEQRTDNCKVPTDKRGTKPRPDTCSNGSN
jgi:hypothetical protein